MFKTGIIFLLRNKRVFEISEVEITRVDCICTVKNMFVKFVTGFRFPDSTDSQKVVLAITFFSVKSCVSIYMFIYNS